MLAMADRDRLQGYLDQFRGLFRRRDQARWAAVYLQGLLLDLPRKNVETLARHVTLPTDLDVEDVTQALHNFINRSPWDDRQLGRRFRALMAQRLGRTDGVIVLDEIALPKQGEHSVGVQRQFSGTLGVKSNCQIALAVHYVSAEGYSPLVLRLYLPSRWLSSAARLDAAGVPPEYRARLSKAQLALALLDEVRAEGFPGGIVVAGAGAGGLPELLDGLERRQVPFLVEAGPDLLVVPEGAELPSRRQRLAELAPQVPRATVSDGGSRAGCLAVRLLPDQGGAPSRGRPLQLVVTERAGGEVELALAHLPEQVTSAEAANLWHARGHAWQGRQQLSTLGLDHFEGRSWRGFHHHACLVMVAYGFRHTPEV
jgi:SRSO17 transposase